MSASPMTEFLQRLRTTLVVPDAGEWTDGQLLERFVRRRDAAAVEALVRRHGPTVWGVCCRVLDDPHDAEDAFQATFLVLVRKAATIRSGAKVGSWLYGVAHQTALKARATRGKRRRREQPLTETPAPAAGEQDVWNDLRSLLDREVSRLSDKYRAALVLCELEGKSVTEAARQLGVPQGTVASRLARARATLAKRLALRGLALSAGALAALLSRRAASAGVPPAVKASAVKAATLFAECPSAAGETTPVRVVALAEGVLKTMFLTQLKTALAVVLGLGFLGVLGLAFAQRPADGPREKDKPAGKDGRPAKLHAVMVQDFEKPSSLPRLWVVGIPEQNASVKLSADDPSEGKQCLKLHYHFTGGGQYLGVANAVKIKMPVHKLHFMLRGDGSGVGYGVYVEDAHGETHKFRKADTMKVDFTGWKEAVIDLDAPHETWGGDKNGKIDYPITGITFEVSTAGKAAEGDLAIDALSVDSEKSADETLGCEVSVQSPDYCADVKGDTKVTLSAPGFSKVTVKCWKQGRGSGADSTVAAVELDPRGKGSFVFPADDYPHGPVTLRISGSNGPVKDTCYLQLYNRGGVSWNEGMPKDPPPAAKGMKVLFADDFRGPLSISATDRKATYYDHKPPDGHQDFSAHAFSNPGTPKDPFAQVDTYLRIRASDKAKSAGLICSLKPDGSGVKASAPCYFECRFLGPNAVGAWPAFWLMTDYVTSYKEKGDKAPVDELDVIEAYGGEGPRSPNAGDLYMVTPHCWNQGDAGKGLEKTAYEAMHNPISMRKAGVPSTWYEAFHTYGCKVTEAVTIYYCDDVEVGRHKTFPLSKSQPLFFMVNLATGGGWPVDLSRYDGRADMYVDYVRVYQKER